MSLAYARPRSYDVCININKASVIWQKLFSVVMVCYFTSPKLLDTKQITYRISVHVYP